MNLFLNIISYMLIKFSSSKQKISLHLYIDKDHFCLSNFTFKHLLLGMQTTQFRKKEEKKLLDKILICKLCSSNRIFETGSDIKKNKHITQQFKKIEKI